MPRYLVCLTFDFDVMTGFIARGMTTPTPISRGEFGLVAIPRILDLLASRGIRATFCVPGVVIEMFPAQCEAIVRRGHEIAHHGYTHVPPAALSRDQELDALLKGIECIRELTGNRPKGYRSPSWDLSPHTIELLLREGFDYESSMMGDDYTPYFARLGDRIESDAPSSWGSRTSLVELPISWTLDDYPHFEYVRTATTVTPGLMNAESVLRNWIDDFIYMQRIVDWGVLTYTLHPFVIGRGHRMLMLERLLDHLTDSGAVFATMAEAAGEFRMRAGA